MTATTTHPLPRLGLCDGCKSDIRIRTNGALYAHDICAGSGRPPAAVLEPTFARWLYAQRNGDLHTDPVARLGDIHFNGCSRSPNRTPADVEWTTADELHQHVHDIQRRRTGSENRRPDIGERCDWHCRQIADADTEYQRLLREAA